MVFEQNKKILHEQKNNFEMICEMTGKSAENPKTK